MRDHQAPLPRKQSHRDAPAHEGSTLSRRGISLRLKLNLVVLPLLALSLGVVVWADYHHEVEAVMAAHALHSGPVSGEATGGPVSPGTSPGEVAGRALRIHATYGVFVFVLMGLAIDAAVWLFVIRPLRRIQETIALMARGHWRVTPDVVADDEVGRLSGDFNRLGFTIDALAGQLLNAERLATLALLSRRLHVAVEPQVERIGHAVAGLHAGLDSTTSDGALRRALTEISDAAARIAGSLRALDQPFDRDGSNAAQPPRHV